MNGLMMDEPLLISSILRHAERFHGDTEIVSRRVEGDVHRTTWREVARRARKLADALGRLGITDSDRVASLAWNGYRHLELYYAVSGRGAVMHTINPRLFAEQLSWIIGNAEDKLLFFDLTFLPIAEAIASSCKTVKAFVAMCDRSLLPTTGKIPGLMAYEDLLAEGSDSFQWPTFDEQRASSMCYSSGTTGNPKGVVYSHRSTLLHAYGTALPDSLALSARDAVLPVVPMFHVNAWGIPYAAGIVGSRLVFPGPHLDGKSLYELCEAERVTFSAGVPTVWLGLLSFLKENKLRFSSMERTVIGGAACPPSLLRAFQDDYGVRVLHAWGMTEMSPIGTVCQFKCKHRDASAEERLALQCKQGRPVFGVDMKIVDADGKDLPWDGKAFGDLMVKGPWIASGYYRDEGGPPPVRDGWLHTGDVATIDADGYLHLTDRSKDVIKSGGEWISSIEIENVALSHPAVQMAACIAARHPKWQERPLLVVVKKPGQTVSRDELLRFFEGKVARWWKPDDVVFVDSIPLGATGKMLKTKLREQFKDHALASLTP
jgi:fatty-acyl-CoA synthase